MLKTNNSLLFTNHQKCIIFIAVIFDEILVKREEFKRIALYYSQSKADDIVQDLLLKLWEMYQNNDIDRIIEDGELNMSYIAKAIRNIYHEQSKYNRRRCDLYDDVPVYDDHSNMDMDYCLKREHPYYRMLLYAYQKEGTMMQLASKSKISYGIIQRDINYIKKKLITTI